MDWKSLEERQSRASAVRETSLEGGAAGRALAADLIGAETLLDAFETYLEDAPGAGAALDLLLLLRPQVVVDACLDILRSEDPLRIEPAVHLLADIGSFDERAFDLVEELIDHPLPVVRIGAAVLLEEALFRVPVSPDRLSALLAVGARHEDPEVRVRVQSLLDVVEDARLTRLAVEVGSIQPS